MDWDSMPLDTPDHVRYAWHLINSPMVTGAGREEIPDPLGLRPSAGKLTELRDRVRMAAIEYGMGDLGSGPAGPGRKELPVIIMTAQDEEEAAILAGVLAVMFPPPETGREEAA